jgi:amino acid permease
VDPVIAYLLICAFITVFVVFVVYMIYKFIYKVFRWLAKDTYDYVHERNQYDDDIEGSYFRKPNKKKFRNYFWWD